MPGGSIRPFCDPLMVTSTPHSSWRKSALARPEMLSTINRAGWPAASMALRTEAMSEVTPVEVSLCTTHTAFILRSVSLRRRASIRSACTPRRQPPAWGRCSSLPSQARNSVEMPRRVAIFCHSEAKCPVSNISTWSPALRVLHRAASHAPVPEAG